MVLLRKVSRGKDMHPHQLVLIDHGLHDSFSPSFRIKWCGLWWALVRGDEAELAAVCASIGIQRDWNLIPWVVLAMPYQNWLARSLPTIEEFRHQLSNADGTDAKRAKKLAFLDQWPMEMHKALKVNMQVRGIYLQAFGRLDKQSWVSFQKLMATYACAGLAWKPDETSEQRGDLRSTFDYSRIPDGSWIRTALGEARKAVECEF